MFWLPVLSTEVKDKWQALKNRDWTAEHRSGIKSSEDKASLCYVALEEKGQEARTIGSDSKLEDYKKQRFPMNQEMNENYRGKKRRSELRNVN